MGGEAPAPAAHRAAVLGSPISHSLSPVLHRAAYEALGLPWTYEARDVSETALAPFFAGLDAEWVGLSLTMPLKTAAVGLCDSVSALAVEVGAVNTVTVTASDGLAGDNTDVPGMAAALRERGLHAAPGDATVLGGGATARSALAALAACGARVVDVYVRRPGDLAPELQRLGAALGVGVDVEPWGRAAEGLVADVVVATAPAGATDALAAAVPYSPGLLLDVVYAPWPTPLAASWADRLGRVASGLDLLVHQAALQVARWSGRSAPVDVMRAAGEAALRAR